MTKKWTIIQNIVATVFQAWALLFLYLLTDQIINILNKGLQLGAIQHSDINVFLLVKTYHIQYLTGTLAFCGGFALLYDKKWGWVACVVTSLLFMGFMLVAGRNGLINTENAKTSNPISYMLSGLFFFSLFILLVLKPFRAKYKPSLLNWLVIVGILVVVLVDKQAF